ncbi:hypothetical protein Ocin01_17025 [Orchesella cincta]|uniref:Kazal-like domain-containing protein n=1 Tax=Orchesella cincta TaxID=48709 RepID=A0A1D2M9K2_ORCCI|nr:hypothetical protein Ocin01_17025 [Orchesella cincta]
MPHRLSETKFLHGTASLVLLTLLLSSQLCFGITSTKRQATGDGILAGDLLPPPALSKSFPTLKPRSPPPPPPQRNNNLPLNNGIINTPSRDLLPPGRPAGAAAPRPSPATPTPTSTEFPLLPPIEIPPEKPLTDSEISAFKETSFIPTTGQGAGTNKNNAASAPQPQVVSQIGTSSVSAQPNPDSIQNQRNNVIATQSSSNVRFPSDSSSSAAPTQAPTNCPSCECTSEVDYICGSNRVLYLNSCSFDCATVCDAGLKKIPLEFCVSQNQQR